MSKTFEQAIETLVRGCFNRIGEQTGLRGLEALTPLAVQGAAEFLPAVSAHMAEMAPLLQAAGALYQANAQPAAQQQPVQARFVGGGE